MALLTAEDTTPPAAPHAIVILSDGVWEALIRPLHTDEAAPTSVLGETIPNCLDADDDTAEPIAHQVMESARRIGLDDNATVAVAHITALPDTEPS